MLKSPVGPKGLEAPNCLEDPVILGCSFGFKVVGGGGGGYGEESFKYGANTKVPYLSMQF